MKAVVVEIKNDFAAVLSDDGCFTKVKNNNYKMGQVIEVNRNKVPMKKKVVICAASAAFLIAGGVTAWAYETPYSYVSLDVNPSIEYSVNVFDRVIDVNAVNDDGQDILDEMNLDDINNQDIEDAIAQTVDQI
jgi:hypothetical protein